MRRWWAAAAALFLVAGCASSTKLARATLPGPTTSTSSTSTSTTTTSTTPTTVAPATTTTIERPVTSTTAKPVTAVSAGGCPGNLANSIANTYSARQLVTVEASGYRTDVASVSLWQKSGNCWEAAAGPWSSFIGYNGFAPPGGKQEGDGKTPTGIYGFGSVIYGNAANPGVHEAYQPIDCGDWWDEDSSSSTYNTFQDLSCDSAGQTTPDPAFDNGSSEKLWEETNAYPSFAVIDYNTGPIVKGAGSAIFFHASLGHGTAGCVSVALANLDWFLRWMEPSQDPLIVMGTTSEITRF